MTEDRLARILAYVDGELPAAERMAFEAEMAADPALAEEVSDHRALSVRVAGAYAPVLDEPVPVGLTMAASAANDRGRSRLPMWAAVAASLVLGVFAGRLAMPDRDPMTPRGQLSATLDKGLAADAGAIRVGLTFQDKAGRWCRTFESTPDKLAGLACREGDAWRLEVAAGWDPSSPDYRQAASATPPAVLAAVDDLRAGDTLDGAAEKAARDAGWVTRP
jgi:hypothetical protein